VSKVVRLVVDDVVDNTASHHHLVLSEVNLAGSEALHFTPPSTSSRPRCRGHCTTQLRARPVREEDQSTTVQLVGELERVADTCLDVCDSDERFPLASTALATASHSTNV